MFAVEAGVEDEAERARKAKERLGLFVERGENVDGRDGVERGLASWVGDEGRRVGSDQAGTVKGTG